MSPSKHANTFIKFHKGSPGRCTDILDPSSKKLRKKKYFFFGGGVGGGEERGEERRREGVIAEKEKMELVKIGCVF